VSSHEFDGKATTDFYGFGKVLGQGSFGKVRLAWHRLAGAKVAIKSYEKSRIKDAAQWQRVQQEIKLMERLNHPYVVRLLETIENAKRIHIVMEFAGGGNLCNYVKARRRLPEPEARKIFLQILLAVEYMHSLGIIHRDIKLENVLFDSSRDMKLVDFGFSVACKDPSKRLKVFCGTPSYMAPEIVQRKEYLGRPVDIWSLGVLLYACLCGSFPFVAKTYPELYKRIAAAQLRFPEHVSNAAKDLIRRMLHPDPLKRIPLGRARRHPWAAPLASSVLRQVAMPLDRSLLISDAPASDLYEAALAKAAELGFSRQRVVESVLARSRTCYSSTYYLVLYRYGRAQLRDASRRMLESSAAKQRAREAQVQEDAYQAEQRETEQAAARAASQAAEEAAQTLRAEAQAIANASAQAAAALPAAAAGQSSPQRADVASPGTQHPRRSGLAADALPLVTNPVPAARAAAVSGGAHAAASASGSASANAARFHGSNQHNLHHHHGSSTHLRPSSAMRRSRTSAAAVVDAAAAEAAASDAASSREPAASSFLDRVAATKATAISSVTASVRHRGRGNSTAAAASSSPPHSGTATATTSPEVPANVAAARAAASSGAIASGGYAPSVPGQALPAKHGLGIRSDARGAPAPHTAESGGTREGSASGDEPSSSGMRLAYSGQDAAPLRATANLLPPTIHSDSLGSPSRRPGFPASSSTAGRAGASMDSVPSRGSASTVERGAGFVDRNSLSQARASIGMASSSGQLVHQ
jgi:hypothetical protein